MINDMDQHVKVAFLSHSSELTGAPISLLVTVRNLDRKKFEPVIVCPQPGPLVDLLVKYKDLVIISDRYLRYRLPKNLFEYFSALKGFFSVIKYIIQVAIFLRVERISVVHVNTLHEIPGSIAALVAMKPIVWQIHEFLPIFLNRN